MASESKIIPVENGNARKAIPGIHANTQNPNQMDSFRLIKPGCGRMNFRKTTGDRSTLLRDTGVR